MPGGLWFVGYVSIGELCFVYVLSLVASAIWSITISENTCKSYFVHEKRTMWNMWPEGRSVLLNKKIKCIVLLLLFIFISGATIRWMSDIGKNIPNEKK